MKQTEEWRKQLMADNVKLAYYVVNKYGQYKDDEEIAVAEEALVRAALAFNPEKGTTFATYATTCIRLQIKELNINGRQLIHARVNGKLNFIPVDSFESPVSTQKHIDNTDTHLTIEDMLAQREGMTENYIVEKIALRDWIDSLSKREKQILQLRMKGLTQLQVANKLGISQAYCCRIIKKLKKQYLKRD